MTFYTKQGFWELINSVKRVLQEERINIQIKYTIPQYTTKVGIIVGYDLEYINTKYIKQKLLEKEKYTEEIFKIKHNYTCKKDFQSKYLVIHTILNEREKVDYDL